MPLYDYMCRECETFQEDVFNSIAKRESNAPGCEECGEPMELVLASPSFKIMDSFRERLNKNYDKHRNQVRKGEAKPNSIDRYRGNIG